MSLLDGRGTLGNRVGFARHGFGGTVVLEWRVLAAQVRSRVVQKPRSRTESSQRAQLPTRAESGYSLKRPTSSQEGGTYTYNDLMKLTRAQFEAGAMAWLREPFEDLSGKCRDRTSQGWRWEQEVSLCTQCFAIGLTRRSALDRTRLSCSLA